jgi:hypothetical protein
MELLNGTLNGRDLRNTLAGMALMVCFFYTVEFQKLRF